MRFARRLHMMLGACAPFTGAQRPLGVFAVGLLLAGCQSLGDTYSAVQPVSCAAAQIAKEALPPDATYGQRAAAAAAAAALCTPPLPRPKP